MRINHNISALFSYNRLTSTQNAMDKNMERLSSGFRINRAADDAAGLAISEKMRAQIAGLNQAVANAQDAISLVQTAEGALNETHSILQRMRELANKASNGVYGQDDRDKIQAELVQLKDELNRIASQTEFNQKTLLNGAFTGSTATAASAAALSFHIGANANQTIKVNISTMSASALGAVEIVTQVGTGGSGTAIMGTAMSTSVAAAIGTAGDTLTVTKAEALIDILDNAISQVSLQRSNLGAVQNRLDHTINNLTAASENLTSAESRIRDADMAQEMVEFTKNQILTQAGTAMLAQANMKPQTILQLFQ